MHKQCVPDLFPQLKAWVYKAREEGGLLWVVYEFNDAQGTVSSR